MGRETAQSWLDGREPVPPMELRSRLDDDLGGTDPLAVHFTEAAVRRLRRARERPGGRAAAFDLLVADAYLTYACEAAVDPGVLSADQEGAGPGEAGPGTEEILLETLRVVADRTV